LALTRNVPEVLRVAANKTSFIDLAQKTLADELMRRNLTAPQVVPAAGVGSGRTALNIRRIAEFRNGDVAGEPRAAAVLRTPARDGPHRQRSRDAPVHFNPIQFLQGALLKEA
jgi:hypothetical protein